MTYRNRSYYRRMARVGYVETEVPYETIRRLALQRHMSRFTKGSFADGLGHYILDRKHRGYRRAKSILGWARSFEKTNRTIASTFLGSAWVSTIFLGLDHSFGRGPPILFESEVFGGDLDGEGARYATWDEAEAGHKALVERVKARLS